MAAVAHLTTERLREILDGTTQPLPDATLRHIEECEQCRSQMERLAGDAVWWSRTAETLSSVGDERAWESGVPLEESESSPGSLNAQRILQHLDPPGHPEMLGRIDHYDIEQMIGQGGMGVVFKAMDRELHRLVAVKFLAPHLAASGVARQRFIREARAAAAVVHPNVVPIYAIHAGTHPYLVMALVSGKSLQSLVETEGPLSNREIVRISLQVAAGLAAAHKQGLIHRDIKPSNILADGDVSRVMITDFGLARAADDAAVTQTGWLAGTPHYMSPEQARGGELDARSDLFSLGSAMYFLATGREPFRAEKPLAVLQQICHRKPPALRSLNAEVEAPLAAIIERLMEKRPEDRFPSADEVHHILERYLAHLHDPRGHRCPRGLSRRRFRYLPWLGSVMALLAILGIWLASSGISLRGIRPTLPWSPAREAAAIHERPDSERPPAMPNSSPSHETATTRSVPPDSVLPIDEYLAERQELESRLKQLTKMLHGTSLESSEPTWIDLEIATIDLELQRLEQRAQTWDRSPKTGGDLKSGS